MLGEGPSFSLLNPTHTIWTITEGYTSGGIKSQSPVINLCFISLMFYKCARGVGAEICNLDCRKLGVDGDQPDFDFL